MLILDDVIALLPFLVLELPVFSPYITKNSPQNKILQMGKTGYRGKLCIF